MTTKTELYNSIIFVAKEVDGVKKKLAEANRERNALLLGILATSAFMLGYVACLLMWR